MAKARTSITLDETLYEAALVVCSPDRENRDFSNLVEVALRDFLSVRNALPECSAAKAEILALAEQVTLPVALQILKAKFRSAEKSSAKALPAAQSAA
jgi:metal-responsive CopG/Arc/MetJ family transcriptional regulator